MKKTGDKVVNILENLEITQRNDYQNYTLDSRLVSKFCRINRHTKKILDIGTGNGIIPLLLSKKSKSYITGIEILEISAGLAMENVKKNRLEDRIKIIHGDIKNWKVFFRRDEFDQIVTNPPFFKLDDTEEQLNDLKQLTTARHEYNIKLEEIIEISSVLLKNNGYFTMVHRSERLTEIINLLTKYKLEPKRIQFCHTTPEKPAKILLIEAAKNVGEGLIIEKPIIINNINGQEPE